MTKLKIFLIKLLYITKDLYKKCKFQFILFFITLLIGLWVLWGTTMAYGLKTYIYMIVFAVIPPLLFGIDLFRKYKFNKIKKTRSNISLFTIFLIIVIPIFYLIMSFVIAFSDLGADITNPKYYKDFMYRELYIAFPKKIPKTAEDVEFFHRDPFLQGGEINYLYYIDKTLNHESIEKKYKEKAIWVGKIDGENQPQGTPDSFNIFWVQGTKGRQSDFTMYVMKASCYKSDSCNHGEFIIVAYNDKTKEIIYKEEDW